MKWDRSRTIVNWLAGLALLFFVAVFYDGKYAELLILGAFVLIGLPLTRNGK